MLVNDRRRAIRFIKRVPMRVVADGASSRAEEPAECLNISAAGVYFATGLKLQAGSSVQLHLKMPEGIFVGPPREWKFAARVVHVQSLGNKSGVGAQFLYYCID